MDLEPSVAHATAIKTLAQAQLAALGSALTVYLDQVPEAPSYPYAVLWSGAAGAVVEAERLAGWGQDVATTMQATVAGLAVADAIGGMDRLWRALHRRAPSISGRVCGDVELEQVAQRPVRDPVLGPDGVEVWTMPVLVRLQSAPASNAA